MRAHEQLRLGFLATALIVGGCNGSNNNNGDSQTGTDATTMQDGTTLPGTAGTCESPIDLATAGLRNGMATTFSGSTEGAMNVLHPNPGCSQTDAAERVFRYHFPDGVNAVRVTTEGSGYDTTLYARVDCSQPANPMDVMDLSCNNDSYDHAPQSTLYILRPENPDLFIVVDGSGDSMMGDTGSFTLTVTEVALGAQGNPCRAADDGMGNPNPMRCDGTLRCSEGGGPDGTALCVTTVPNNMACDPRGFMNTCVEGSTCAADPTPPEGMMPTPLCSTPGSRAGAPCAMTEPRCTGDLACGSGDFPICVRSLAAGAACDPMGFSNVCGTGLTCRPMGDAGEATCAQ